MVFVAIGPQIKANYCVILNNNTRLSYSLKFGEYQLFFEQCLGLELFSKKVAPRVLGSDYTQFFYVERFNVENLMADQSVEFMPMSFTSNFDILG